MSRMYRFSRFFLNPISKMVWPTTVINKENFENFKGGMIICNHYTSLDGVVMGALLMKDELNVVAKQEAFEKKFGGWYLKKVGCIPVNRGEADIQAMKAIMNVLKDENRKLLIFPEGTRNRDYDEKLLPFKHGPARFAIKAKRNILPMIYHHSLKKFKRTYLYIGEPIDMSQFFNDKPTEENKERATQYVYEKMLETRRLCNEAVDAILAKKNKKKKSKKAESKVEENA